LDWKPLKGVGPFQFGSPIEPFLEDWNVQLVEEDIDSTGWITYEIDEGAFQIHMEDDEIISIACYQHCYFQNQDLIGLSYENAKMLFKYPSDNEHQPDRIFINDYPQFVYDFGRLGAQLWVKDGIVVTVFCNNGS